tara:strand:+ start:1508 stop:3115 length:1608 start_codon:yes stop_codon:yes gene_type:complete
MTRGIVAKTFLVFAFLILNGPASADSFEETIKLLDTKKFGTKNKVIGILLDEADDRSLKLFEKMLAGQLFFLKKGRALVVGVKEARKYKIQDFLSGEELGEVKKRRLRKVSINNKLRNKLQLAIGALALSSAKPKKRERAAYDLIKNGDISVLPTLNTALKREPIELVQTALLVARHAIQAKEGETESRIASIEQLSGILNKDILALLNGLTLETNESEPEIRAAAENALKASGLKRKLSTGFETLFFGLSLGSVLLLAAVGLAITFGVMGVINMAHGEMIMIGAYTTFVIQQIFPNAIEYSLLIAVPAAFLVSGIVGIIIERGVIRYLYGRPLETLLATFGISLILQQAVRSIFSPLNRSVITPEWMSGGWEINAALLLTYNRLTIIIFTIVLLGGLAALMRYSSFGLQMRAVTQNRRMASAMGIKTNWVDALTFGFGSGIAGIAGVALSQLTNVGPNLGQQYIVDSFMVVVFGGVGNIWGTALGAIILGVANKLLEPWSGAVLGKICLLVFIILFIQKRPRGMFALKGRAAES